MRRLILFASLCLFATHAQSDSSCRDPDRVYWLLGPVPSKCLRDMALDGADATENPYTLDAGHFQLEVDAAIYNFKKAPGDGEFAHEFALLPFRARLGLFQSLEVQLVFGSLQLGVNRADGMKRLGLGVGDITTRFKYNIVGNDEGIIALSMIPFLNWPALAEFQGYNQIEAGLIGAFGMHLSDLFDVGVTAGASAVNADVGHQAELFGSVALSFNASKSWSTYAEFAPVVQWENPRDWRGTLGIGANGSLSENLMIELGVNIGLTPGADTAGAYFGVAGRF